MQDLRQVQKQIEKLSLSLAKASGTIRVPTFKEFALEYQMSKLAKTSLRASTKRVFEYQLKRNLIPAFGSLPIDQVTVPRWNAWVLEQQSLSPPKLTRFFNARKCLIEILNAAYSAGLLERVPKLDNPDEHKNVGRVLTDSEVASILKHTTYPLFRLFFYTMAKMGCRPREILQWQWSMIEWKEEQAWITIPASISKTGRTRRIPLNSGVAMRLKELQPKATSRFVFPNRRHADRPQLSYHGAWKTACTKAGVKNAVVYDLRRTLITKAMAKNQPSLYVAKILDTSVKMIESTYAKEQAEIMQEIIG